MTPRILWVIRGLGPGGAEQLLASFAGSPETRFAYDVAYTRADKFQLVGDLGEAGVHAHLLERPWPLALSRLVRHGGYSIVHSHAPLPSSVARLAVATRRKQNRPVLVYTEHNVWSAYRPPTRAANALTSWVDSHRYAVSDGVRRSMPGPWRASTEVLTHGVDRAAVLATAGGRDEIRAELGIGPDTVLVGIVANYRPEKAWPDLLRAARTVIDARADVRFIGIGQGPLQEEIERLHGSLGLGDGFQLLGYQPNAVRYIAAMDVFCLSSRQEGLPVALMEAMVLGVPTVCTSVGGIPEVITDGEEGLLVTPSAPEELAKAIERIVGEPRLRNEMGRAAAAKSEIFSIDSAVRTIEARYVELLAARAME